MDINLAHININQAALLKKIGFDVKCKDFFLSNGNPQDLNYDRPFSDGEHDYDEWVKNWNAIGDRISRPTQYVVMEWMRLKYGVYIYAPIINPTAYVPNLAAVTEAGLELLGYNRELSPMPAIVGAYSKAIDYLLILLLAKDKSSL